MNLICQKKKLKTQKISSKMKSLKMINLLYKN